MKVGAFSVVADEDSRTVNARTNSNTPSEGTATCFEVFDRRGRVVVGDIFWETGERDVRVLEVLRGGAHFGRLLRGGRIGVYDANFESFPEDVAYMELAVMKLNPRRPNRLPTAVMADYETLRKAAGGLAVWDALYDLGAKGLGTRSLLFGDTGTRRNYLVATFPSGSHLVPLGAFILTRLTPLSRRFTG